MKRKYNLMLSYYYYLTLLLQVIILNGVSSSSSCDKADRDALTSVLSQLSSKKPSHLNWTSPKDCCKWEGVSCNNSHGRVNSLSLPGRELSGNISTFLGNITYLSYLNLSLNQLSGHLPVDLFEKLPYLRILDLSSNKLEGPLPSSSICKTSQFVEFLDFSYNDFGGPISHGFGACLNLKSLRAGFNALTGWLPYDLYSVRTLKEISLPGNLLSGHINESIVRLSNLTMLELHTNKFTGEIPRNIGDLTNLEQLLLHTNNLSGTLPASLTECKNLTTLLLRNNRFDGEISTIDFSKLRRVQTVDLGNNSFVGRIPETLCTCTSLTALRLAHNKLTGQVPRCMASLTSLEHLSLTNNYLTNISEALDILQNCKDLTVLLMSRCFYGERLPDDEEMSGLKGFKNLQMFALGGCRLTGQIPSWIARLRKIKVLNLSYNLINGPIPPWLGDMPNLSVLNLTQNYLSGNLPREIGRLPALISGDSSMDLSYLALPFLFRDQQYNRIFNLIRGLKLGNNSLSGKIPEEIGRLRLLQVLDLSSNRVEGSIPDQLSNLVNLEEMDLSNNRLSGEIPSSLAGLSFLSQFSVANNDLQGEVPQGGQFPTFTASSFEGNPKLCSSMFGRSCGNTTAQTEPTSSDEDNDDHVDGSFLVPFGVAYLASFFVAVVWRFTVCNRRQR